MGFYFYIYYLDHMPESTCDINHFNYCRSQSLHFATTLFPLAWPDHNRTLKHGQWKDPQGTSVLRNDYWFLDHKETFIFTSKTCASVIGLSLGIDQNLKGVCQPVRTYTHWKQEVKVGARESEAARNQAPVPRRAWNKSVAQ